MFRLVSFGEIFVVVVVFISWFLIPSPVTMSVCDVYILSSRKMHLISYSSFLRGRLVGSGQRDALGLCPPIYEKKSK